jgi:HEAT repeat protein
MRAWVVAALVLAVPAQKDAAAAAAGLGSADPAARTRAACELRELGSGASPMLPRLAALLDDGSPVDPAVCGERTWRRRNMEATTTPGEQAAAALVAIGSPAKETLMTALVRPAWIARRNAAWALGALNASDAVDGLIGALGDAAASVRKQAAWALGAIGDSRAVTPLTRSLKDPDAGVRKQAAWALGAIGG